MNERRPSAGFRRNLQLPDIQHMNVNQVSFKNWVDEIIREIWSCAQRSLSLWIKGCEIAIVCA